MNSKLLGVFLLLMGIIVLPMAAIELKDGLAAKKPTPLTWKQFGNEKPKSGWFKITGAQLDVVNVVWVESIVTGKMGNIYVPARAANDEGVEDTPIEMLVKINDPKIAATVQELKKLDKGTDEAAMKYVLSHAEQLIIERPLEGTLADGFDEVDSGDKSAIQGAGATLANDFVILQEGAKPSIGGRIFMLLAGLSLSALGLFLLFKKPVPPAQVAPPTA